MPATNPLALIAFVAIDLTKHGAAVLVDLDAHLVTCSVAIVGLEIAILRSGGAVPFQFAPVLAADSGRAAGAAESERECEDQWNELHTFGELLLLGELLDFRRPKGRFFFLGLCTLRENFMIREGKQDGESASSDENFFRQPSGCVLRNDRSEQKEGSD